MQKGTLKRNSNFFQFSDDTLININYIILIAKEEKKIIVHLRDMPLAYEFITPEKELVQNEYNRLLTSIAIRNQVEIQFDDDLEKNIGPTIDDIPI